MASGGTGMNLRLVATLAGYPRAPAGWPRSHGPDPPRGELARRGKRAAVYDGVPASREPRRSPASLQVVASGPCITSEVATLRRVLVHRPGGEVTRLSPDNLGSMLFDDVPWAEGAAAEHAAFCDLLRSRGVDVVHLTDLLADVLATDSVRASLIGDTLAVEDPPPSVVGPLTEYLESLDAPRLATALIAGVASDGLELPPTSLAAAAGDVHALAPLPNQMFTRDSSAWVHDRQVVGAMATPARRRERLHLL